MSFPSPALSLFLLIRVVVVVVSLTGVMVLLGWALDVEIFKRVAPQFVAMNPVTALLFICASISLLLRSKQLAGTINGRLQQVAKVLAMCVTVVGFLKLLGLVFQWSQNIDTVLFRLKLAGTDRQVTNQMAPNTAFNFVLIGIALFMLEQRYEKRALPQVLPLIAFLVSWLALIGYVYGSASFYEVPLTIPMALHTATMFLLLSAAILWMQTRTGFMAVIASPTTGGHVARRILPSVILIPSIIGWLRLFGERRQWYGTETGVALMVAMSIAFCVVVVLLTAASLNRLDSDRSRAQAQILKLNADLTQRATELEFANQELESFSYSVSHDLRAPLRHITGFVDLLRKDSAGVLKDKSQRYADIIADSARQMGQLIDDLLVFSRMGRTELKRNVVDLNELVEETISALRCEAADRKVIWKKDTLPQVIGDVAMLRQVFVNLLANALKYTRPRDVARIEVASLATDCEYIISVRDNGVGFDMKFAEKLFGVFQRLHHADEFEGTGIGLANVRRIVQRHGGRTWAESALDNGATFFVTLPKTATSDDLKANTPG